MSPMSDHALISSDQLRLMGRVARMYHEQGRKQPEIAAQLHISQPRVSRLLKEATRVGIVRTIVELPAGLYADVEEQLTSTYGLRDAVVVDTVGGADDPGAALAPAAAQYLDNTLLGKDTIGISSWSRALLETSRLLKPRSTAVADRIVQLMGGLGSPEVQIDATRLMARFADATGGMPVFISSPGVVATVEAKQAVMARDDIVRAIRAWTDITLALVGIGSSELSPLLASSGAVTADDRRLIADSGVVGDVCLRYFDADGALHDVIGDRLVGIDAPTLKAIPRRVAIAGGSRKVEAIRAALLGDWVNVLITDHLTALELLQA